MQDNFNAVNYIRLKRSKICLGHLTDVILTEPNLT